MTVVDVAPKLLILYSCKVGFFSSLFCWLFPVQDAEVSLVSENLSNSLLEHACNTTRRLSPISGTQRLKQTWVPKPVQLLQPKVSLNPLPLCPRFQFGGMVAAFIKPHKSAGKTVTGSQATPSRNELIPLHSLDIPWDHRAGESRGRAQISRWINHLKVLYLLRDRD